MKLKIFIIGQQNAFPSVFYTLWSFLATLVFGLFYLIGYDRPYDEDPNLMRRYSPMP